MLQGIADWDAVYKNAENIADGASWPGRWVEPARLLRERLEAEGRARLGLSYGPKLRNRFDLFLPLGAPRGLVVFVHGGFWLALDRSYWSHMAQGPLAHGFAVAIPEYTLCPEARISQITHEIGAAITAAAAKVEGPLLLAGHSAGGHLVSRMGCADSPLADDIRSRLAHVMSVSGLHDLRPLQRTRYRDPLRLDDAEALRESPVLLDPLEGLRITCWVGGMETSEFRRQSALLANIWRGMGAATDMVEEPDRHHFNILDGLAHADHPITRSLLTPA
ncbi:alpha/beta hydrolase [Paracoccus litorisediminis]|uniref:Alpha/beta hydrolase fold domain-containing protein n=1 Tax=Paracoccus litorisediminis TaxID=2006130 RepID=A0A844HNA4_9RHOB|nr:alpha/beta hydrolase [Paracoccus litorisediminis]MTH60559.1 alpha/beta hydrolase fold domain-containing protein [Paracoccus litorisediminis]